MDDINEESDAPSELGTDPGLYPIRVVAAQTGIGIHTLRAWERRYGLPRPTRTAGTHRLYRLQDIILLRRVQALIARGTPPSRACALVLAGNDGTEQPPSPSLEATVPVMALRSRLRSAFDALDDAVAAGALSEAFTLFDPEAALEEVILPVLADIGTAWAEGRASVAAEHFASAMIRARLLAAFDGSTRNEQQPTALLGAGPGEGHEIPAMALSFLLRRRGWRAVYLGPDTPVDALHDAVRRTHPRLVCLSATTPATAVRLIEALRSLQRLSDFAPVLLTYGGAPFRDDPTLHVPLQGIASYLGDDLRQAAQRADTLLRAIVLPPVP